MNYTESVTANTDHELLTNTTNAMSMNFTPKLKNRKGLSQFTNWLKPIGKFHHKLKRNESRIKNSYQTSLHNT